MITVTLEAQVAGFIAEDTIKSIYEYRQKLIGSAATAYMSRFQSPFSRIIRYIMGVNKPTPTFEEAVEYVMNKNIDQIDTTFYEEECMANIMLSVANHSSKEITIDYQDFMKLTSIRELKAKW